MKKFLLAAISIAVTIISIPAHADFEDEQWPIPNEYGAGHHSVLIEDSAGKYEFMSMLRMYSGFNQYLCTSLETGTCATARSGDYRAVLPPCLEKVVTDCIVSLEAISPSGEVFKAVFKEFIYGLKHPNLFTGDGFSTPKVVSEPGIWLLEGAPHAGGNEYALSVSLSNSVNRQPSDRTDADLDVQLFPISRLETGFTVEDVNGFSNIYKCIQRTDSSGEKTIGCGGGAQEFGRYRCAMKMIEKGTCLLRKAFPTGMRYKLKVQFANEPAGMMHGRLLSPEIELSRNIQGYLLTVEAGSVRVPILSSGDYYTNLSSELKTYWDDCIQNNMCGFSTRIAVGNDRNNPLTRNIQDYAPPFGDRSIKLVSIFSNATKDKSVAAPSAWNLKTLSKEMMRKSEICFKRDNGFIGIVTTNSTTYSEGPPAFVDGSLNYRVASLHYLPNGEEFLGNYNLILRSDVARCLYGFTSAPVSATVSVISSDGKNQVATTVVSERGNWLNLGAAGFTFSSPMLKVKLVQNLPETSTVQSSTQTNPMRVLITCVKGKATKKIKAVNPKCPAGYKKSGK